jgi:hypothetical protein
MVHTCQEVTNLRKCSWLYFVTIWLLYFSCYHFGEVYQTMLIIKAGLFLYPRDLDLQLNYAFFVNPLVITFFSSWFSV